MIYSHDRMPAILARLKPRQDHSPMQFLKARLGIVDEPLVKGGKPGAPGLHEQISTDRRGRKQTQWVRLPTSSKTVHNEAQAEFFDAHGNPYESVETRPGTTAEQRGTGINALQALEQRLHRLRDSRGSTASLLGARLFKDFVAAGGNQLTGQSITCNSDLAALAQVYRDPRFETFRCIYVRNGVAVGEAAYSSRLPGAVQLPVDIGGQIIADSVRFGATGYYMLHNHPSGAAKPSKADVALTINVAYGAPGFLGHVVVDHKEYSTIDSDGATDLTQAPELSGPDYHSAPAMDHPLLGAKLINPADVALAAKALQAHNGLGAPILIQTKGEASSVTLIASAPIALVRKMAEKTARAQAWIRGIGRASGAGSHTFLVVSADHYERYKSSLKELVSAGILTDAVSAEGRSIMKNDLAFLSGGRGTFDTRRGSIKVAEAQRLDEDLAAQEKWLADGAKRLGYESIDDLATGNYPEFERLAIAWREQHQVADALYQPGATYGDVTGPVDTESPAFKRWFGNSKVVDVNGDPLRVYHGTRADFEQFDHGQNQRLPGFWFTPESDAANSYAASGVVNPHRYPDGANVIPVYLSLKNPRVYHVGKEAYQAAWSDYEGGGYDGFMMMADGVMRAAVAKHPEQIKSSISNTGEYSGPAMTKSIPRLLLFREPRL